MTVTRDRLDLWDMMDRIARVERAWAPVTPREARRQKQTSDPSTQFRDSCQGSMLRRCGASGPTELRHEVKGIAAINAGEILRIELAACEALDMIGSVPEGKIGTKEDLFR
jgi:hypothetical protein